MRVAALLLATILAGCFLVFPQDFPDLRERLAPDARPHLMPPAPPHPWPSGVSSGAPIPPPSPAQATGTARIVVLLVEFADVVHDPVHDAAYFDTVYNAAGPSARSMRAYYGEGSFGALTIQATIVPTWSSSARTMGFYGDDGVNVDDANGSIYYLVGEAVRLADPSVDFSTFDGDANGIVDHVVVVHAGRAQEEDPTNEALIWSHRWVVSDGDRTLPGSQALTADGVQVFGYIMVGEASPVGVVAHEFGHDLGLPDLYDTDESSEGGVGLWDLMAQGAWNGFPRGSSPAHLSAWSRIEIGWTPTTDVTSALVGTSIPAVESSGRVYRLVISGTSGREYFLVENRQRIGFDAGLPGTGLLIWHVDDTRASNDNDARRSVDLEEADEASTGDRPTDPEDAWRSSAVGFGPETTPGSRSYGGADTGWRVRDISASGDPMTATIARDVARDVAITEVRVPLHVGAAEDVNTTVVVRNDGAAPEDVDLSVRVYQDRIAPAALVSQANTTWRGLPAQTSVTFNTTFRTFAMGRYLVLASAPLAGDEIPTNNERIAHALANEFHFRDDVESGNGSWTRDGTPDDPHRWRVVADADEDGASHSPSQSWRFGHVPTLLPSLLPPEWHTLTSPDISVPAGAVHLIFYHRYDLWGRTVDTIPINVSETDRARVEVSLDGGPWSLEVEFTGRDLTWHAVSILLRSNASVTGTVRVRFNASAGVLPDRGGWWVDDVMLAARGLGRAVVLLAPEGPVPGSPRTTVRVDLKVANVGEFEDLFLLSAPPPGPGWTIATVTDGTEVPLSTYTVLLAPDHDAAIRLVVAVPWDAMSATTYTILLGAASGSEPGVTAQAILTVAIADGSGVSAVLAIALGAGLATAVVAVAYVLVRRRRRGGPPT